MTGNILTSFLNNSMGAKVQTENTKLNVPGAGSYESPSKVSRAVKTTVISSY